MDKLLNSIITEDLEKNLLTLKKLLINDDTLRIRTVENAYVSSVKCAIIFIDGLVQNELVNDNVIHPIINSLAFANQSDNNNFSTLERSVISVNDSRPVLTFAQIINAIIYGDTVVLMNGYAKGAQLNTKGFMLRSVSEPDNEKALYGPREGFIESMMMNLTLLRRKIQSPHFKMSFFEIGAVTKTKGCICYLENVVNRNVLKELEYRLTKYKLDSTLDINYIQEFVKDSRHSIFKTTGSSERPDVVAAGLLEGRIAVVLDGTPFVMTVPYLFIENFQSTEDYYTNYYIGAIGRILRVIAFFIAIMLPSAYLAIMTYSQELIPTELAIGLGRARQGVPFPTFVEILGTLLCFQILQEAGARTPSNIGQSLSIVGALVLGQAAIDAKFVSTAVVIVVATSSLCSLMLARFKGIIFYLQIGMFLATAILSFYGFIFALTGIFVFLCSLDSFGIPYMSSFASTKAQDSIVRFPWFKMKRKKVLKKNG